MIRYSRFLASKDSKKSHYLRNAISTSKRIKYQAARALMNISPSSISRNGGRQLPHSRRRPSQRPLPKLALHLTFLFYQHTAERIVDLELFKHCAESIIPSRSAPVRKTKRSVFQNKYSPITPNLSLQILFQPIKISHCQLPKPWMTPDACPSHDRCNLTIQRQPI